MSTNPAFQGVAKRAHGEPSRYNELEAKERRGKSENNQLEKIRAWPSKAMASLLAIESPQLSCGEPSQKVHFSYKTGRDQVSPTLAMANKDSF